MTVEQEITKFLGVFEANDFLSVSELCRKDVIIYGAGCGYFTFASFVLNKYKIKPYLVLDTLFETDTVFSGINACSPKNYQPSQHEQLNSIVVVTIGNKDLFKQVQAMLCHKMGFKNVIWAFELYEYSLHHTPVQYISNIQQEIGLSIDKIKQAYALLEDDLSKEIFKKILGLYFFKKAIPIPSRSIDEQYFPEDIKLSKDFSCFVDCGAYTGDTVQQLLLKSEKLKTLICFEPDAKNFKSLLDNVDFSAFEQVVAFPCGLYQTEETLKVTFNDSNSSISETGDSMIQVVALDHVIHGVRPTFIKMDIEGAEGDALLGAKRIIQESSADLAISIYHLVEHLWLLPLLIHQLNSGYKFYLRNYTSHVSETVLYATKC